MKVRYEVDWVYYALWGLMILTMLAVTAGLVNTLMGNGISYNTVVVP